MTETVPVTWLPRSEPLIPILARLPRHQAQVLLTRELTDDMRGLVTGDTLLLFADPQKLPWTPSVRYFGRDARVPSLFLPTHSQPSIPHELFEHCLRRKYTYPGPLLVDPQSNTVTALPVAQRFDEVALKQFIEGAA